VDAAFAEIVAGLEREGVGTYPALDVPDEDPGNANAGGGNTSEDADGRAPDRDGAGRGHATPAAWRGHESPWDWSWNAEDEHYIPPEPPPLPRPRPVTLIALALLVIGVLLLAAPGLFAVSARVATPIALISLAVGIGMILLGIRHPPSGNDRDDGAQL